MLQGGGHPVVLDFGLAGSPDLSTGAVTESLYGSVCYLAPEQARTQKVGMDPRTDVYQLGLILYEMLTLRRAFPGAAIGEVLKKIETGFFELPRRVDPRVPRDLEAICTMALEVQPDRRYSGARAMREDLERWLEGRSPLASRSARWRSLVRTARYTGRRHPVLAGAAAVVLALGAGALAWSGGGSSMLSLHPFRFDLPTATTVMLPPRGSEIHPHEWLGVNVVNSQEAHVWALSIFGKEGEERRVYPWRATFPSEHGRSKDPTQPWGLVVPPAESPRGWNLLCTQMSSEAEPGSVEGLLVFASTSFVPEVERWMQILSEDRDGTLYSKACTTLGLLAGATFRGVPPEGPGRPETAMDWARAAKTLGYTSATTDLPKLNLPGIESVAVECRVVQ
jgi:hypothetical protein